MRTLPVPSAARHANRDGYETATRRCFRRRTRPQHHLFGKRRSPLFPGTRTAAPLPCSASAPHGFVPCGLLHRSTLIRRRRLNHLLTTQAPGITPAAAVLARLVAVVARSVTSVRASSQGPEPGAYVPGFRLGTVSARHFCAARFRRAKSRNSRLPIARRSVPVRHRLRSRLLARALCRPSRR